MCISTDSLVSRVIRTWTVDEIGQCGGEVDLLCPKVPLPIQT